MITLLQWPCSISPSRNQTPGAMRRMVSGAASERATNRATAASETNPVSKPNRTRHIGHPLSGLLYTIPGRVQEEDGGGGRPLVGGHSGVSGVDARRVRLLPGEPLPRSEEHTSELQSLRHLVCRLLLEKK